MQMSDIFKDMAAILTIADLVGPEAAKELIGNKVKKAAIEATETVAKKLSDAQKKELEKQKNGSSKINDKKQSQESSVQNTESSKTVEENPKQTSEINDTAEISQSAKTALESETTKA